MALAKAASGQRSGWLVVTNGRQGSERKRRVKRAATKAWHVSVKGASRRAMVE